MIRQEHYNYGLPASPGMLPSLFYGLSSTILRSPSPSRLSVKSTFSQRFQETDTSDQFPLTPPPEVVCKCPLFFLVIDVDTIYFQLG